MRDPITVTKTKFKPASALERETGLLGFVALVINDSVGIDGVTVRRSADGDLLLSWPEKRDRHGIVHRFVRPMDAATKTELERQVFARISEELR